MENNLNSIRRTARIAGILIVLGILSGLLSIVASVEGENYLTLVYPNRIQVLTGAFFQFLLVPIYIGFSLVLYPVLKTYNPSRSIGFVGFRIMAGVFQLLGVILLPMFILLSQKFLAQSHPDLTFYETIGEMLKLSRDLANHLGVILATGMGNLLMYSIFLKGKLVPRWLSVWGIIGNLLIMIASFLLLFELIEVVSMSYGVLSIPLVIQEMVLAFWLIWKGLRI
ncbi:DUF4386 domain-containing protein [Portibacter lacus]|uniref:DUF4386 domain-containing protein n=1 Tax=Portibacter lacus TaxID=1099794 RepID=A0AA37SJZ4_9BACT|nr:DUF4386 domain-containing protein [Portibacter lacus]GLR16021.1 hypothetical protein GCM10007940_06360 [Portibacter lacus]